MQFNRRPDAFQIEGCVLFERLMQLVSEEIFPSRVILVLRCEPRRRRRIVTVCLL